MRDTAPFEPSYKLGRPYSNWEGLPYSWTPNLAIERLRSILEEESEDSARYQLAEVGLALTDLLIRKNERYGNSALQPVEVFAKGVTARQRMAIRMDDKINRLANGLGTSADDGEHPGIDLAGYILLDILADWAERGGSEG